MLVSQFNEIKLYAYDCHHSFSYIFLTNFLLSLPTMKSPFKPFFACIDRQGITHKGKRRHGLSFSFSFRILLAKIKFQNKFHKTFIGLPESYDLRFWYYTRQSIGSTNQSHQILYAETRQDRKKRKMNVSLK